MPYLGTEDHEFAQALQALSKCFCYELMSVAFKLFYLLDFGMHQFVLLNLVGNVATMIQLCVFASSDRYHGHPALELLEDVADVAE